MFSPIRQTTMAAAGLTLIGCSSVSTVPSTLGGPSASMFERFENLEPIMRDSPHSHGDDSDRQFSRRNKR